MEEMMSKGRIISPSPLSYLTGYSGPGSKRTELASRLLPGG